MHQGRLEIFFNQFLILWNNKIYICALTRSAKVVSSITRKTNITIVVVCLEVKTNKYIEIIVNIINVVNMILKYNKWVDTFFITYGIIH